jgi:hypothetical protein
MQRCIAAAAVSAADPAEFAIELQPEIMAQRQRALGPAKA